MSEAVDTGAKVDARIGADKRVVYTEPPVERVGDPLTRLEGALAGDREWTRGLEARVVRDLGEAGVLRLNERGIVPRLHDEREGRGLVRGTFRRLRLITDEARRASGAPVLEARAAVVEQAFRQLKLAEGHFGIQNSRWEWWKVLESDRGLHGRWGVYELDAKVRGELSANDETMGQAVLDTIDVILGRASANESRIAEEMGEVPPERWLVGKNREKYFKALEKANAGLAQSGTTRRSETNFDAGTYVDGHGKFAHHPGIERRIVRFVAADGRVSDVPIARLMLLRRIHFGSGLRQFYAEVGRLVAGRDEVGEILQNERFHDPGSSASPDKAPFLSFRVTDLPSGDRAPRRRVENSN